MFSRVGRQLAILNSVVVVAIILLVGSATYFTLQHSLNNEINQALRDRIASVQPASVSQDELRLATTTTGDLAEDDDHEEDEEEDEHEEEDREIVASGDTVLIVVNEYGSIIDNPRGVDLQDLPVSSGIEAALADNIDTRSVTLNDGKEVRVMTAPLVDDGRIIGAVQAIRSLDEYENQLRTVRRMTLLGIGLGLLVAAPAGYYLSRRAMVPINQAFERQRAFAADASHELRTPLTLIRANAEVGLKEPGASEPGIRTSLNNILQEVDRTNLQVDDLLILARLDAGELQFDRQYYQISQVAEQAVESMQPVANRRQVNLQFESSTDVIAFVDSDRIQQVVRIVLDNAIKHTEAGGLVSVRVSDDSSDAIITVEDSGSGIPDEGLPHIFDRFYRVERSRSRVNGGSGLGLSIAQQMVQAHNGKILVESVVAHGTTITIRIPFTR